MLVVSIKTQIGGVIFLGTLIAVILLTTSQNITAKQHHPQIIYARLEYVIDGDTLIIRTDSRQKLRLIGVDSPEPWFEKKMKKDARKAGISVRTMKQLGKLATNYVKKRLSAYYQQKLKIELDSEKRDKYGRLLGYLWLPDDKMLNREIIRSGYGKAMSIYPNNKYYNDFFEEEKQARKSHLGLWAIIKKRW